MFSRGRAVLVVLVLLGTLVAAPGLAGASDGPEIESAIAFVDTAGTAPAPGNTVVEVRFDREIDLARLETGNLTVGLRQGTTTPVRIMNGSGSNDRQFFLDLGPAGTVPPIRVSNVSVTPGRTIVETDGTRHAAADVPTAEVTATTTTLTEGGQEPFAWRGETVAIVGDEAGEQIEVRPRRGFGLVKQVAIPDDGQVFALETGELSGTWYRALFDGRNSFNATKGDRALELANFTMAVAVNENPDKDDATVTDTENLTGTVSTNAAGETLSLVVRDDEETVRQTQVTTDGSGEATFDFPPLRDFPDEDWHFTLVATHVASGETVFRDVKVSEVDHDAGFDADAVEETRGDVVEIPVLLSPDVGDRVAADRATVVVGSDEVNYRAVLTVYDGNNDHRVDLEWNTYVADGSGDDPEFAVAETDADERDDAVTVEAIETTVAGGPAEVLDPTLYPVSVRAGANRGGAPANDTIGAVLAERPPATLSVDTAPSEEYEEFGDLRRAMTAADRIADGQYVVVRAETPGLFGDLAARTDLAEFFVASDESEVTGDGVELSIEEAARPNREPQRLAPGDVERVFTDPENDTVALLVDAGAVEWLEDGQFQAVWRLDEDHGLIEDDTETVVAEERSHAFTVVEPEAQIHQARAGEFWVSGDTVRISGESTLAPGTSIRVLLERDAGGAAFGSATIEPNGTFVTTFETGTFPVGATVTATPRLDGDRLGEPVEGQIAQPRTPTPTERATQTTEPRTTVTTTPEPTVRETTPTPTTEEGETTSTSSQPPGTTNVDTPGFGFRVGILALFGVLLLARRS